MEKDENNTKEDADRLGLARYVTGTAFHFHSHSLPLHPPLTSPSPLPPPSLSLGFSLYSTCTVSTKISALIAVLSSLGLLCQPAARTTPRGRGSVAVRVAIPISVGNDSEQSDGLPLTSEPWSRVDLLHHMEARLPHERVDEPLVAWGPWTTSRCQIVNALCTR